MRKLLAVTCVLAAACGGGASFQQQASDSMPDSSGVAVGPQQSQSSTNALTAQGSSQAATSVDAWYAATVAYSVTINTATAWTLGAVAAVTATTPTSCTATSCTWGPSLNALDPNDYQLTVSENANGSFDWHLDARSKANVGAGFVTIITGNAVPSGQRHRGTGTFTVDLDAAKSLSGHATDQGTIVVSYSNLGPVHVQATFNGFISQDANHLGDVGNAYYNYQQDITGGGDMEIAFHDVNTNERDDIHSRWKVDGSGRADVTVQNPPPNSVQFSNCWSAAAGGFVTVYGQLSGTGSVSACSYLDAAFGTHIGDPA
jgi:hypothetical protein